MREKKNVLLYVTAILCVALIGGNVFFITPQHKLNEKYKESQASYAKLQDTYKTAQQKYDSIKSDYDTLKEENATLSSKVDALADYEELNTINAALKANGYTTTAACQTFNGKKLLTLQSTTTEMSDNLEAVLKTVYPYASKYGYESLVSNIWDKNLEMSYVFPIGKGDGYALRRTK